MEELVDHVRSHLDLDDMECVRLVAGTDPDRDIWAAANQYPFDPQCNRLVIVRDADKIKRWAPLRDWLDNSRFLPTVHLLFVSSETDFPYDRDPRGKPIALLPHAEWVKDRGRLVKCSTPEPEVLVDWVLRRTACDERAADYLLQRTGGDLSAVLGVCAKAEVIPGDLTEGVIDVLCSESAVDDFAESLIQLRKPQALLALEGVPYADFGRTVGLVESRLDLLLTLNGALRQRMSMREIAMKKDVQVFLARAYLGVAKHYDQGRVRHARRVLAVVDDALRGGAREGPLEALVALW